MFVLHTRMERTNIKVNWRCPYQLTYYSLRSQIYKQKHKIVGSFFKCPLVIRESSKASLDLHYPRKTIMMTPEQPASWQPQKLSRFSCVQLSSNTRGHALKLVGMCGIFQWLSSSPSLAHIPWLLAMQALLFNIHNETH